MDMQMYNLVKNAMKEGKSAEDLVKEINSMAATAKKELEPKEPIKKEYVNKLLYGAAPDGKVRKTTLITLIAAYFVQNGFNPDEVFDTENQYRSYISSLIDGILKCGKMLERTAKASKESKENGFDLAVMGLGNFISDLFSL